MSRIIFIFMFGFIFCLPLQAWSSVEYELTLDGELITRDTNAVQASMKKKPVMQVAQAAMSETETQTADEVRSDYIANESTAFIAPPRNKKHSFTMGFENYSYTYQEFVDGEKFMSTKGRYKGYSLEYAYRFYDDAIAQNEVDINEFRLQARYADADVDYNADGFSYGPLEDYMFEVRALGARNFNLNSTVSVVPYAGLGYRYLNNGLEAIPARVEGADQYLSGYNRESQYIYIPVGADLKLHLKYGWEIAMNVEYDHLVRGRQESHLEDMEAMDGTNFSYDTLTNSQRTGYGLRGSIRVTKAINNRISMFVEPYVRYWSLKDSDIQWVEQKGTPICEGNTCAAGKEPKNTTQEIGIKVGLGF